MKTQFSWTDLFLMFFIVITTVSIICIFLRQRHIKWRREARRCSCGSETVRIYQMIHDDYFDNHARRAYRYYQYHIFDRCTDPIRCGRVRHVHSDSKWFSLYKLAWRFLTNPGQFTRDERLFEAAGLIPMAVASLPERMRQFAHMAEVREEKFKAKAHAGVVFGDLPKNPHRLPVV